jgi:hypothetical protein
MQGNRAQEGSKGQKRTNKAYKLNTPPALFLLWIGCTTTKLMPKPTVNPILVLINCSAVLKPLKYDELEPEVWSETKLNRPPLPRPEGS